MPLNMADIRAIVNHLLLFTFLFKRTVSKYCRDWKNCQDCAEHSSWSGESCRWCPVDLKCHAHGSVLNKCSVTQNIVDPKDCNYIPSKYSSDTAYRMVMLSAVAYSDNAIHYLSKALPCETFSNVIQIEKTCPGSAKCSGFTAVSHVNKEIVLAFRGSESAAQVIAQAISVLTKAKVSFPAGGTVQEYFKNSYDLVWSALEPTVYTLIRDNPSYKVLVTGHSLGGALASMVSTAIGYDGKASKTNIFLYTFGQPRVGNYEYAKVHDDLVKASWRVVHYRDPVVHLPTCKEVAWTGCIASDLWPYHHGTEIFYDSSKMVKDSSYKKCLGLPHNEDKSCSNSITVWGKCVASILECIDFHKDYFGVQVGTWWKTTDARSKGSAQCSDKEARSFATRLQLSYLLFSIILSCRAIEL